MKAQLNTSGFFNSHSKPKTRLKVDLVYVTPSVAKNFLTYNRKNRTHSENHVRFLAKQMTNGNWIENGESIVFDINGYLKDGQHRLLAIIKSGKSYWMPVVDGVEPNSMATFDTGKNRSASDVLSINGFKNASKTSSLIKSINSYCLSKSKKASLWTGSNRADSLTNQGVLDYCEENYDWLSEIVRKCDVIYKRQSKPKVLGGTQLGLIAYLIGGENPSDTVYDFLKNITGIKRQESTSSSYLYAKLHNSKINKEPLNFYWVLGMSIKAWNYYVDGNPSVKYFKFSVEQELPRINK